ncbi:DUF2934 domain-containing protein [Roseomonas nepalensis]|uniref:DUF2934 domain-containing protein n=1 Tax=Muricoccus nepalensis TaxID=1854500 RepID=A0A502FVX6_9PROT|nr:DUF2934 domain-containing protein [Roseomonas nepalensis]TPG53422.1 DUF2934 domain-containing protein [Roseomonas nepalensis]
MAERLIDVTDPDHSVLHTYPVTLPVTGGVATDAAYGAKALEAAAHGQLVPDAELGRLVASPHVSRGGTMEPYGDVLGTSSETKLGLEQQVREHAYRLWEQDGRPEGMADDHWRRALDQHLRERAYVLWQQEGCPAGRADENWHRVREFEAY